MEKFWEKEQEEGKEKHLPTVKLDKKENKIEVNIGEQPHPMLENHYIKWIELSLFSQKEKRLVWTKRKFLRSNDEPKAVFLLTEKEITKGSLFVRSFCNLHGLWKKV